MSQLRIAQRIEALLKETYQLWDPGWVTFNWRNYTYDHVQRVRGLSLTLARREGANPHVTELAALLHDVTKPFDGEYVTGPDGRRLIDESGFWHNEPRPPARQNWITRLYDQLGLYGSLHNESGAVIAERLLSCWGLDADLIYQVAQTIRDHLIPPENASIESCCLYDADTIDANIGLPALVRNLYINLHFYDQRRGRGESSFAEILSGDPAPFLASYVGDSLPRWAEGKRRDFVGKLTTRAGCALAATRLNRLDRLLGAMQEELEQLASGPDHSRIDLLMHYMRRTDDPSIWVETEHLRSTWSQQCAPEPTLEMLAALRAEMLGEE